MVATTAVTNVASEHGFKKQPKDDTPSAINVNAKAKKLDPASSFEVMPGVYLQKVKRAQKAA